MTETITTPDIHCSYDELVDLVKLVPHPRNPNTHPDGQIELLAKIIEHQGWRAPITVSKRSGFIIRGHGRLMAAQKLGLEQAPVDYQDYANEAEEWADLVADNRVAELAQIDQELRDELLGEIDASDLDSELSGYGAQELEKILMEAEDPAAGLDPGNGRYEEQYGIIIVCENEAEQQKIYEELTDLGYECKVVAT